MGERKKRKRMKLFGFIPKRLANKEKTQSPKFLAMSKLLGIIIMVVLGIIVSYTMFEMHYQQDLSSLPQLIISVFGIGSVYIGFYLTMAKWEHVESEKTKREKEVIQLKKDSGICTREEAVQEEIQNLEGKIDNLTQKATELESQEISGQNY